MRKGGGGGGKGKGGRGEGGRRGGAEGMEEGEEGRGLGECAREHSFFSTTKPKLKIKI